MNAIITVALYFGCFGIVALCLVLVVSGVLRWLKPGASRTRRLNTLSWIAAAVLFVAVMVHYTGGIAAPRQLNVSAPETENVSSSSMDDNSESASNEVDTGPAAEQIVEQRTVNGVFLQVSGAAMKFFLLCIAISAAAVLVVIGSLCLYRGVRTVIPARSGGYPAKLRLAQESEANLLFAEAVRSPMVILAIVGGVLALFFLLPFLTGDLDRGMPLEIWKDGVCEINHLFGIQPETTALKAFTVHTLASYLMMYIVVIKIADGDARETAENVVRFTLVGVRKTVIHRKDNCSTCQAGLGKGTIPLNQGYRAFQYKVKLTCGQLMTVHLLGCTLFRSLFCIQFH